jgi:hypothetical protein
LYRIEKISDRHGVSIARSTLAQWVGQLGVSLQPLVDRKRSTPPYCYRRYPGVSFLSGNNSSIRL